MAGPNKPSNQNNDNKKRPSLSFLSIVIWAVLLVVLLNTCMSSMRSSNAITVSYTEFRNWVAAGYVEEVQMSSNAYLFTLKEDSPPMEEYANELADRLGSQGADILDLIGGGDRPGGSSVVFQCAPLTTINDDGLIDLLIEHDVKGYEDLVTNEQYMLSAVISYVFPTLIMVLAMVLIYRYMFKKMGSGGIGGIGGVGKANAKVYMEKQTGVTFRDVAGQDEAKEALEEIVTYLHDSIEDAEFPAESFEVVLSSLALHYVASFEAVAQKVHACLTKGGSFVFSVEHPIFTAYGSQDWYYDAGGKILHFPVDNYFYEGERQAIFLGEPVTKYHKTLTTYLNGLLENGFELLHVVEPQPPAHMLSIAGMKDELRRPMMLIVSARKK